MPASSRSNRSSFRRGLAVAIRQKRIPSFFVQAASAAAQPARISAPPRSPLPERAGKRSRTRVIRTKQASGMSANCDAPRVMKKGVPIRIIADKIPLAPALEEAEGGAQKAEGHQGEETGYDWGNAKAFFPHVPPAADDRKRQEQWIVPVAPVQAAGECLAPVIAAPEEKTGMHVPDEPGVPPAVGFLQNGQDEGGRRR